MKSDLAIPLYPAIAGDFKVLIITYLHWFLNSSGRAMRKYGRFPQRYQGSTVQQWGTGCTETETLPGHSVCVWEGKSWFLAHLCVTMPTSSQFRLPSYLFSQIIFIIKNDFS